MDYTLVNAIPASTISPFDAAGVPSMSEVRKRNRERRADVIDLQTTTTGFAALADVWERETRNSSDIAANEQHWAYRSIVRMGPTVIPQIIDRMRTHGGMWFAALAELAQWDPIMPDEWGNMRKMREAWYRWEQSPDAQNIPGAGPRYILPGLSETS